MPAPAWWSPDPSGSARAQGRRGGFEGAGAVCGQPWTPQATGLTLKQASDSPPTGGFSSSFPAHLQHFPKTLLHHMAPKSETLTPPPRQIPPSKEWPRVAPEAVGPGGPGCSAWAAQGQWGSEVGSAGPARPWLLAAAGCHGTPILSQGQVCSHGRMTGVRPREGGHVRRSMPMEGFSL